MNKKKIIIEALEHRMSLTEIAEPLGIAKTTCWMLLQQDEDYKKANKNWEIKKEKIANKLREWKISKENIARDILEMSKR